MLVLPGIYSFSYSRNHTIDEEARQILRLDAWVQTTEPNERPPLGTRLTTGWVTKWGFHYILGFQNILPVMIRYDHVASLSQF